MVNVVIAVRVVSVVAVVGVAISSAVKNYMSHRIEIGVDWPTMISILLMVYINMNIVLSRNIALFRNMLLLFCFLLFVINRYCQFMNVSYLGMGWHSALQRAGIICILYFCNVCHLKQ